MWFWQAMQALSVLHVSGNRLTHVWAVSKRHALIQRCNMNDMLFFVSPNFSYTRTVDKSAKTPRRGTLSNETATQHTTEANINIDDW